MLKEVNVNQGINNLHEKSPLRKGAFFVQRATCPETLFLGEMYFHKKIGKISDLTLDECYLCVYNIDGKNVNG